jgi:hypothetical protein
MPRTSVTKRTGNPDGITAVGIDVGGARKGFHAVAITGGGYSSHIATKNVKELSDWCRESVQARVIAVVRPAAGAMMDTRAPPSGS